FDQVKHGRAYGGERTAIAKGPNGFGVSSHGHVLNWAFGFVERSFRRLRSLAQFGRRELRLPNSVMSPVPFAIHLEHVHPQHVVFHVSTEFTGPLCIPNDDFFSRVANSSRWDLELAAQSCRDVSGNPVQRRHYGVLIAAHIASFRPSLGS